MTGGTVDFLYDLSGHEVAQVTSTGSWTRGEIYAGGRHLGTYSGGTSGATYFTFSDWLGTERARSIPGATAACETITSLPFGDGQTTTGSCGDPSPMHFTGKERDTETGLDNFGARYDSSQYGRFMTPDWSAKPMGVPYAQLGDPQTLNLYTYVRNNPLRYIDADGHCRDDVRSCYSETFNRQTVDRKKETVTITRQQTTYEVGADGTKTETRTTTSATFSLATNNAGQFLGATSQTSISTGRDYSATGVPQSTTKTGPTQNIGYGGAAKVFGPASLAGAADWAARGGMDGTAMFFRAVGHDAAQHPGKYAFYGVEAAAALTPLPEAYAGYEGIKAGADVVVGAAHLLWDLTH